MTVAVWIAFVTYALAALAIGWRAAGGRSHDAEFWTAGRRLSGASVGLSLSAGFLSVSWSCVYAVQLFYWYGAGAVWLITVPWLLALAGIWTLARRYRGLSEFSHPEMVGSRFGPTPKRLVAAAVAFVFLAWGGAEIYVAARLLSPSMGVSVEALILLVGLVVAAYAALGGFRAVVDTDKLQFAVVSLYILAMAWLALRGLQSTGTWRRAAPEPGAAWHALLALPLEGARSGTAWSDLLAPGLATIAITLAAYLPGWIFETDLWVRIQAARDAGAARAGVLVAAASSVVFIGIVPLFIGVAALAIYPPVDGVIPDQLGAEGDAIFAALVTDFAPAWLALLVAVGLVAAAMSTIDTCVHVMALSVAYDLLGVHRRPDGDRRSRLVTLGAVVAACAFALRTESLWDVFYLSSGVLSTAVAFPVAAVFLPRVRPAAVSLSSALGLTATVVAYFLEARGALAPLQPDWLSDSGLAYILWGLLAATLGGAAGQLGTPAESG